MADPNLYVDLDAMNELTRQLGQIRGALTDPKDDINDYAGRLGSERIEDALNDFVSGWKDGRKKILEAIDGLLAKAQGAVDTYLDLEQQVIKATKAGG
jgi:hypothetical protein